jgi:selenocysteine lyase/cysteine desulfurase
MTAPTSIDTARLGQFKQAYPAYQHTAILDSLRATEYARLDRHNHVYLDYTGGGLYADSQVRQHLDILMRDVYGNPHSSNPTSQASTQLDESARHYVLKYFNASPDEYTVIFTPNASGALKLVGESYPFGKDSRYLLTFDNHNSVNGIREFARVKGATVTYIPLSVPNMNVADDDLEPYLALGKKGPSLFAYPAQSNFSGVQHPLQWIEWAHDQGWDVLLDAAAFAPSNRLDLSRWHPDFVDLSFYKMFGYPTGIGCLLARKSALAKLHRPWFAGGTITVASVQGDRYFLAEGEAAFEDGTINYLGLPAIEIGLKHIESIGIETIHERVSCMAGWLIDNLFAMRHRSGHRLVRLYGPPTLDRRGGTVTVNFYDQADQPIDHREIERLANAANISIRTGCFCNPGGGELALGITGGELSACFRQPGKETRFTIDDFRVCVDNKSTGAVRMSVGLVTNFADVERFLEFARGLLDR